MSMQSMSVRPEQVIALAGQIRNGANGIAQDLEQLQSDVGKLRSQWDGAAQQAYDIAHAEWNKSLTAIRDLLERIANNTEQMAGGYTTSDKASASRFGI